MSASADRPAGEDFTALHASLIQALEQGGYWRASLRRDTGPTVRSLHPGVPLMVEWELPRNHERFDPKDAQRLAELGLPLLDPAFVVTEEEPPADASASLTIRLAPFHPENWEAVQPGDQLVAPRLGVATLVEYLPVSAA
ncbi:MAG: hypothetical protein ACJ74O_06065 [Frankiaceae bacterium]